MFVKNIELENFRNYNKEFFEFSDGVNLICGSNAQGKTNALEAICLLSTMKLFRTNQKKEAIKFDESACKITSLFETQNRDFTLKLKIQQNKTLEILRNDVKIKKQADTIGLLKTVLFCPDDLFLIRDGAATRRKFLDMALCQLRPHYAAALEEYNRLLEHKIRILRDSEQKPALLDLLDDFTLKMSQYGAQIVIRRAKFIKTLENKASLIHSDISGGKEILTMDYKTVSTVVNPEDIGRTVANQLYEHAMSHRSAEIASRSCLSGPHKDDMLISINGNRASSYGSQGQIRTCALSLKLAERELFFDDSGEYPVLLLDDVLSELDKKRQDFVLNHIDGGQVFITCCEEELAHRINTGKIFYINNGGICNTFV